MVDLDYLFANDRWRIVIEAVGQLEVEFEADMKMSEYVDYAFYILSHRWLSAKERVEVIEFYPDKKFLKVSIKETS